MKLFNNFVITLLVILLAVGCYIAGSYQGSAKVAKIENSYNIIFEQTYLCLLDKSPETLRNQLEQDLSVHWIADKTNKGFNTKDMKQLFSTRALKWTEMQLIGFGGILREYVSKHPTNSLSKEAIDYAKSKSMIDVDSLKTFKIGSPTPQ